MTTKGLGDRRDQTDFAGGAIGEAVFASGFAALVGDLLERPASMDSLVNFRGRNNQAGCPVAVGRRGQKINKAADDGGVAGVKRKSFYSVVVGVPEKERRGLGGGLRP